MQDQERAVKAIQWLTWADNDYISARQLILNDLLVQGAGLSNTAIEKYLKTIFIIKGLKFPKGYKGHDVGNLFQILEAHTSLKLNKDYLSLLFKLYGLRYPDDLEVGYNIAINKPKLLVELDYTVKMIRDGFDFKKATGDVFMGLDQRKKDGDQSLMADNCYFGDSDRKALFAKDAANYEFRVLENQTFLEAYYVSAGIPDDDKFDVIGLKPSNS